MVGAEEGLAEVRVGVGAAVVATAEVERLDGVGTSDCCGGAAAQPATTNPRSRPVATDSTRLLRRLLVALTVTASFALTRPSLPLTGNR